MLSTAHFAFSEASTFEFQKTEVRPSSRGARTWPCRCSRASRTVFANQVDGRETTDDGGAALSLPESLASLKPSAFPDFLAFQLSSVF
jgi:hypothetical protein